jgi:hypothetical protein
MSDREEEKKKKKKHKCIQRYGKHTGGWADIPKQIEGTERTKKQE